MTETKRCSKCGEIKPLDAFSPDPRMILGRRSSCKTCKYLEVIEWRKRNPEAHARQERLRREREGDRHRERHRIYTKRSYEKNREHYLDMSRYYRLGAEPGTHARLLAEQGGVCAICAKPPNGRSLHLDHCHATNKLRGVVCKNCNNALGLFEDDVDRMHTAIAYILKYRD